MPMTHMMKPVLVAATAVFVLGILTTQVLSQSGTQATAGPNDSRRQRFTHNGQLKDEGAAGVFDAQGRTGPQAANTSGATEALTGFDNLTNGFDPQGPAFENLNENSVKALRSFNDNRFIFEE